MSSSTEETFAALGVPEPLVVALRAMHYEVPFEIQALTIPDALDGRDILGRAPTGSGKTLAFGVPLLAALEPGTPGRMGKAPDPRRPDRPTKQGRAARPTGLVLCPTRELAEQISRELEPLAAAVDRTVLAVYGGKGLEQQLRALSRGDGIDLLVACPGRLLDLINQEAVELEDVEIVVVDEADRMADMGFLPDVRKLLDQTSPTRQTMLFSATLSREGKVLVDTYQNDPIEHGVAELEPDLSQHTHRFIQVPKTDRIWLAADIVIGADDGRSGAGKNGQNGTQPGPSIVFVRTRHGADRVARQLQRHGVKAVPIHGGRSQNQRDRALAQFTDGKAQALVATDVAARGIHVDGVARVIHYDPPAEDKDYVHRSGRTGRAGASGVVVSLLERSQVRESLKMQERLGIEADIEDTPERENHLEPIQARGSKPKGRSSGTKRSARPKRSSRPRRSGGEGGQRTGGEAGRRSDSGTGKQGAGGSNERSGAAGDDRASTTDGQSRRGGGKPRSAKPKPRSKQKQAAHQGATKRSGKPRPKNRKNRASGNRGRR